MEQITFMDGVIEDKTSCKSEANGVNANVCVKAKLLLCNQKQELLF